MSYSKLCDNIEFVIGVLAKSGPLETEWHSVASKHGISNANHRSVHWVSLPSHTHLSLTPMKPPFGTTINTRGCFFPFIHSITFIYP